ncbi:MAG: hypothetical protein ACRC1T_09970 [Clostridium chrysemydis]|uniref:hypothetical protein n=1 Tax=Clostridium chrysemydis TaxID=2665504 RepID=UPI003F2E985F
MKKLLSIGLLVLLSVGTVACESLSEFEIETRVTTRQFERVMDKILQLPETTLPREYKPIIDELDELSKKKWNDHKHVDEHSVEIIMKGKDIMVIKNKLLRESNDIQNAKIKLMEKLYK